VRGGGTSSNASEHASPPGLRYVVDDVPGIRRKRRGTGFSYVDPRGRPIRDRTVLDRIRSLAVPPAWTDVWIAPDARAHLQATGRDARGRKQYRYHPAWRAYRDQTKFDRMVDFAAALPAIRRRVSRDLRAPGVPRDKVLAVVVALLDRTHVRIGNPEYARDNHSKGLTTLDTGNLRIEGSELRLRFRGKGGKLHDVGVENIRLARIVRRVQDLPGHRLFQYRGERGVLRAIESADVNEYLRGIGGDEISAKDFRTWAGSLHVAEQLVEAGPFDAASEGTSNVVAAIASAADELGNTPAVTRTAYVHPGLVAAYLDGTLLPMWRRASRTRAASVRGLRRDEAILADVLHRLPAGTGAAAAPPRGGGRPPALRTTAPGSRRRERGGSRTGAASPTRRAPVATRRTARAGA
jgi:DNA topoisomerase-1